MDETVFLTGGTGLLGSYLLIKLLEHNVGRVIVLSRGKTQKEAEKRIYQELEKHFSLDQKQRFFSLIKILRGDITRKDLGLSKNIYDSLSKKVTLIYHSAAACKFNIPLEVARETNVKGTENVLKFGFQCKKNGKFKKFNHVSTLGVSGNSERRFFENDLDIGQKFNNAYEQSKFEAEKLVLKCEGKGLPVTIYRPGAITGDSRSGYTNNFEMIYRPLQIFHFELFNEIPADKNAIYSFAPVDYTAEAIIRISLDNNSYNSTYHLASPKLITLKKFVDVASRYFKFETPLFVPKEKFDFKKLSPFQLRIILPYIPYLNYKLRFDTKHAQVILDKTDFSWPEIDDIFLKRLFKFCVQCGFIIPKKKPSLRALFKFYN